MIKFIRLAAIPALALMLCSCASQPPDATPRFNQSASADVIVRFPSWKLINIIKPDTRDNGFLTVHERTEAEQILARPVIQHQLAVVVCGCLVTDEQDASDQKEWIAIFEKLHFKRVVFLRAAWSQKIDGLAIVREVDLTARTVASND